MKKVEIFYGSTTMGKKGQVVIPMETRKNLAWKEGNKLLVFGLEDGSIVLAKLDQVKEFAKSLEKKIKRVKHFIKKAV